MSALVSVRDLAGALKISERAVQLRLKGLGITATEEALSRGGRRHLVSVEQLPLDMRQKLAAAEAAKLEIQLPAPSTHSGALLKDWQKSTAQARLAILAAVDRLKADNSVGTRRAIETICAQAASGALSPGLADAVAHANARAGAARTLKPATVFNWLAARTAADAEKRDRLAALAPVAAPAKAEPVWAKPFLARFRRPHKPALSQILTDWPKGEPRPSYAQAVRFVRKLSALERNAGRLGPRELRSLKPYRKRDTSELLPGDIYVGDGHTLKAWVRHPDSGRKMRPEITGFVDVKTRRWVGWSVALAESTVAVADALRHACLFAGVPAEIYYDNGSGANGHQWDEPGLGLCDVLGITKHNSIAYNSQARGVIERFHRSHLHPLAKSLATYAGPDMDKEAAKAIFKALKSPGEAADLLLDWPQLMDLLRRSQALYNGRPHRGLPAFRDPVTGNKRHMSPDEAWNQALEAGWRPHEITEAEAREAFMPRERRTCRRGVISLWNNEYFAPALAHHHGRAVTVGIDIHDAGAIEVWDGETGQWLARALWNAHATAYAPQSRIEQAREKRMQGRLARLESKRADILAEGAPVIELRPSPTPLPTRPIASAPILSTPSSLAGEGRGEGVTPTQDGVRPSFADETHYARWLLDNPHKVEASDRDYLRELLRKGSFRFALQDDGAAIPALEQMIKQSGGHNAADIRQDA